MLTIKRAIDVIPPKRERNIQEPSSNNACKYPEELTDAQWQELSELQYKKYISRELSGYKELNNLDPINLVKFLCIVGLIDSLKTLGTKAPALLKNLINSDSAMMQKVFILTARNGYLETLQYLEQYVEQYLEKKLICC